MDWVAEWIAGRGWASRRIGIEREAYFYSPKAHARSTKGLPGAKWSDADLLVNWIRAMKSPAEIAYLRKAARLAEGAITGRVRCHRSRGTGVRRGGQDLRRPGGGAGGICRRHHGAAADDPAGVMRRRRTSCGATGASLAMRRSPSSSPARACMIPPGWREPSSSASRSNALSRLPQPFSRGTRGSARRHSTGRHGRRGGNIVAAGHRPPRAEKGIAHRLFDRHRLSAGLG